MKKRQFIGKNYNKNPYDGYDPGETIDAYEVAEYTQAKYKKTANDIDKLIKQVENLIGFIYDKSHPERPIEDEDALIEPKFFEPIYKKYIDTLNLLKKDLKYIKKSTFKGQIPSMLKKHLVNVAADKYEKEHLKEWFESWDIERGI